MKNNIAPEIQFSGLTEDWKTQKLGDLAEIRRGASPRPIQNPKWFDSKSDVGWLRISDVTEQNGLIHHVEQHLSKEGQEKTLVLNEPHLILSIAATVGKPVINYIKTGIHDGFIVFINPSFNKEFMFQWLEMFRPKWQKYGQPGSQVNINSKLVKELNIALPSIEEQYKISKLFKGIDETITFQQQELDNLKQTKQGFMQKMFPKKGEFVPDFRFSGFFLDWEKRKLKDLGEIQTGSTPPTVDGDNYSEEGMIWVTPTDISSLVTTSTAKKLSEKGQIKARIVKPGTILVTSIASIGKNTMVREVASFNQQINSLTPSNNNDSYFLLTQSELWSKKMKNTAASGTMQIVNKKDFSNINVLIPKKEEQIKIGNFFKQLDETIDLHQQELEALQETKKAFLQKMFV